MAKKAKWRRHTLEFKRQVVERMKTCQNIHELARELKIERKLLYTWKYQFEGRPEPRHANLGIPAGCRGRAGIIRRNPRCGGHEVLLAVHHSRCGAMTAHTIGDGVRKEVARSRKLPITGKLSARPCR